MFWIRSPGTTAMFVRTYLDAYAGWLRNAIFDLTRPCGFMPQGCPLQILEPAPHPSNEGVVCVLNDAVYSISARLEGVEYHRSQLSGLIIVPFEFDLIVNEATWQIVLAVKEFGIPPADNNGMNNREAHTIGTPKCVMEIAGMDDIYQRLRLGFSADKNRVS